MGRGFCENALSVGSADTSPQGRGVQIKSFAKKKKCTSRCRDRRPRLSVFLKQIIIPLFRKVFGKVRKTFFQKGFLQERI